jgi:4-carboxymuconolactone decarboxylase
MRFFEMRWVFICGVIGIAPLREATQYLPRRHFPTASPKHPLKTLNCTFYSSSIRMTSDEVKKAHETLFNEGMKIRKKVLGDAHVERSMAGVSDFAMPIQHIVTEACWGAIWSRPGLELRTRSMLNIAMLTALNRSHELAVHVRGAINNGVTEEEIREVIIHASFYAGGPAGLESTRVADKVLSDIRGAK